jgi:hypothetical protein
MRLTFGSYFPCFFDFETPIQRLFERGQERLEKEMDIIKMIKSLRNIKIFLKSKLLDPRTNMKIKHHLKNLISVDTSSESSSSEEENPRKKPKELTTINRVPVQRAQV